jgi:hypothetical protein
MRLPSVTVQLPIVVSWCVVRVKNTLKMFYLSHVVCDVSVVSASRFSLRLMYYDELVTGALNIRDDGELCDGNSRSR